MYNQGSRQGKNPNFGSFFSLGEMSPEQSRAARAWLGWSQADLAERAGVAKNTVHGFESGQRTLTRNNIAALRRVLENEGLSLLFDEIGSPAGLAYRKTTSSRRRVQKG
jgi:transcriptional regulator with XRE-family HTH domain